MPGYYSSIETKVQTATPQNKLYAIGEQGSSNTQASNTITGYILDNKTAEPVIGASVQVENTAIDVITDQYGYYTLSVPKGKHTLSIQSIGMKDTKRDIMVYGDGKLNIEMQNPDHLSEKSYRVIRESKQCEKPANGCSKNRY